MYVNYYQVASLDESFQEEKKTRKCNTHSNNSIYGVERQESETSGLVFCFLLFFLSIYVQHYGAATC